MHKIFVLTLLTISLNLFANELEKVINKFEVEGKNGNVESQYFLGKIYHKKNELEVAKYWYNLAITNGNEKALFGMGRIYLEQRNILEAKKMF